METKAGGAAGAWANTSPGPRLASFTPDNTWREFWPDTVTDQKFQLCQLLTVFWALAGVVFEQLDSIANP